MIIYGQEGMSEAKHDFLIAMAGTLISAYPSWSPNEIVAYFKRAIGRDILEEEIAVLEEGWNAWHSGVEWEELFIKP